MFAQYHQAFHLLEARFSFRAAITQSDAHPGLCVMHTGAAGESVRRPEAHLQAGVQLTALPCRPGGPVSVLCCSLFSGEVSTPSRVR